MALTGRAPVGASFLLPVIVSAGACVDWRIPVKRTLVLSKDIHIQGNNRLVGNSQSMGRARSSLVGRQNYLGWRGHYAEDFDGSCCSSKHQRGGSSDLEQGGSLVGLGLGSWSGGRRTRSRCCRRKRNRVKAVLLPVRLLRLWIRTKSLLRTGALPPRVERLRLGTRLLVMK
jgi:hypothetical protein